MPEFDLPGFARFPEAQPYLHHYLEGPLPMIDEHLLILTPKTDGLKFRRFEQPPRIIRFSMEDNTQALLRNGGCKITIAIPEKTSQNTILDYEIILHPRLDDEFISLIQEQLESLTYTRQIEMMAVINSALPILKISPNENFEIWDDPGEQDYYYNPSNPDSTPVNITSDLDIPTDAPSQTDNDDENPIFSLNQSQGYPHPNLDEEQNPYETDHQTMFEYSILKVTRRLLINSSLKTFIYDFTFCMRLKLGSYNATLAAIDDLIRTGIAREKNIRELIEFYGTVRARHQQGENS